MVAGLRRDGRTSGLRCIYHIPTNTISPSCRHGEISLGTAAPAMMSSCYAVVYFLYHIVCSYSLRMHSIMIVFNYRKTYLDSVTPRCRRSMPKRIYLQPLLGAWYVIQLFCMLIRKTECGTLVHRPRRLHDRNPLFILGNRML